MTFQACEELQGLKHVVSQQNLIVVTEISLDKDHM